MVSNLAFLASLSPSFTTILLRISMEVRGISPHSSSDTRIFRSHSFCSNRISAKVVGSWCKELYEIELLYYVIVNKLNVLQGCNGHAVFIIKFVLIVSGFEKRAHFAHFPKFCLQSHITCKLWPSELVLIFFNH